MQVGCECVVALARNTSSSSSSDPRARRRRARCPHLTTALSSTPDAWTFRPWPPRGLSNARRSRLYCVGGGTLGGCVVCVGGVACLVPGRDPAHPIPPPPRGGMLSTLPYLLPLCLPFIPCRPTPAYAVDCVTEAGGRDGGGRAELRDGTDHLGMAGADGGSGTVRPVAMNGWPQPALRVPFQGPNVG